MATDSNQTLLSDSQRKLLIDLAQQTGKTPADILSEALALYRTQAANRGGNGPAGRTLYQALAERGLIGCLEDAPPDLSTNPKYMEGFGESD